MMALTTSSPGPLTFAHYQNVGYQSQNHLITLISNGVSSTPMMKDLDLGLLISLFGLDDQDEHQRSVSHASQLSDKRDVVERSNNTAKNVGARIHDCLHTRTNG